ncbi:MAG: hypothetical protein NTZ03_09035 [Actinobacteria bacterium]|nr:hypothetical protein [Actinomycetota bacterium]
MTDQPGPPSDSGDAVPPVTPPPVTPPPATPPPPPSGAATPPPPPPPPAPAPGTAGGNVDVGTAVSWAFAKFGQYALIFIGLAAVVFVIRLIQVLIGNALTNSLSGNCANTVITENGAIIAGGNCVASLGTTITAGIITGIITGIIFGALAWIATIGIYRAALRTSDGEVPAFSDLTTGKNLGKYIIVAIVFGILSGVGLVLCIIPGLLVIFFLQFSPLYALDKGQGVSEAFRSSIDAVKSAPVPVLLAMIVNAIAGVLGTWFYGILTLVALPFAALFTVHVYRQLNKEEITP